MKKHRNTRPRFKVLELPWGYSLNYDMFFDTGKDKMTDEECYQFELDLYDEEGDNYDGPLKYLERCYDQPFPPRKGIMYCVRDLFNGYKNPHDVWKPYTCYCYQAGMWWRFKEPQTIFTDLYVPFMSHYDFTKLKCPIKYLSKKAQTDYFFHRHSQELREVGRSIQKSFLRITNE